ncbi:MAG: DUF2344 domain-containing protein [Lachnospiraceae bacterium]|nr:DUF2344 domain-containing protein [Lachnospiraceae bacterium]
MKLRVKFTKHGRVRYIGHLDMQRYFQRLNRRAGLKVVYSEGFSPHQKMSFAMPLSVGYESDAEYFDVEVTEALSSEAIISSMNKEQAEGIEVTDCVLLPDKCENAMASVRAADYIVSFREGCKAPFDIDKVVSELEKSDSYTVRKQVKKSKHPGRIKKASYNTKTMESGNSDNPSSNDPDFREVDIRPLIYDIKTDSDSNIYMKVSAGSKDNIKPELVIGALYEKAGYELTKTALMITRHELYTYAGEDGGLIPLSAVGEEF